MLFNRIAARSLPVAVFAVGVLSAMPASAQKSSTSTQKPVLEEVIVTAQLRTQNLQDVPVSVDAVSGKKLLSAGINKIQDLQSYVPNLTMSETGIGTNIYIRGIGSGINQGFEQSVGMYVDGVSYSRAQLSRAPFLDLARVEVLRGPQNILFGKNSIAGAISMITNKPGDQFEGSTRLLYDPKYREKVGDLILSGPITSSFGARLAFRKRRTDGYIKNLTLGGDEPRRNEYTGRLTLDFRPSDDLGVTFKYERGQFNVNGRQVEITHESPAQFGPAAGLTYSQVLASGAGGIFPPQSPSVLNNTQDFKRSSNGDYSDNNTENYTLTADYAMGENTLTVIGAYVDYNYKELCDCDFTGANLFTLLSQEKYNQSSLEMRLASPTGNTIDYIAGLYYQNSNLKFNDRFYVSPASILVPLINYTNPPLGTYIAGTSSPRNFNQDSDLYAAFTQITWNLSDALRLNLGLRYSDAKKDASRVLDVQGYNGQPLSPVARQEAAFADLAVFGYETHAIQGSRTDHNLAPQLSAEWDYTDNTMFYASLSRGSKSGGFDVRSNADPRTSGFTPTTPAVPIPVGTFEFKNETATSLELGSKNTLLGGSAELNAALFYTEYKDMQVSLYDGKVGFNVGNAAKARTYGLELDGRAMLTERLMLSGALSLIHFEFTDFPNGQCSQGQLPDYPTGPSPYDGYCDYKGKTNQYVANWSGNLRLSHYLPFGGHLELRSALDMIFTDKYNASQTLDPTMEQGSYVKFNGRIAIADADNIWEVALVGKNLTNRKIMTYGNATPLAYSTFYTKSYYSFWERGRSIALQGTYRF